MMRHWVRLSYLAAVYLFLYFPILVLVVYSFNEGGGSTCWQGFTWDGYRQLIANTTLIKVALNSVLLGIVAATTATILGTIAALCLYRYQFYGKQLLSLLLFTLVVSPEIVMGVGLLLFFSWNGIPLGFMSLFLAHTTFCMPFVAVTVYSRLSGMDQNLIKAAKELGANEWGIWLRILFPLLWLPILAGWLLSFTLSLDDVMISFFLSGSTFKVLPLEIYNWVRLGVRPELNALCSVLFGVTLIIVLVSQLLLKKHD
jgi:spermidine/putrescine transport system permease protein